MTPAQRWSLGKRGAMRCEKCGLVLDPLDLAAGVYRCFCGHERIVAAIPVDGDAWSKRHTTLARRVLAFMVDGIEAGVVLPGPTRLADEWGVHHNEMCRVYAELSEDHLISRNTESTTWVRTGTSAQHAEWRPRHLR